LERRRKGGDLRDPKAYKKKIDNDATVTRFENVKQFTHFTKQWLDVAVKYVKPTAPLIIWTNALGKGPTIKLCSDLQYTLIGEFLWAKRTTLTTKEESITSTKNEVLLRVYETALVFLPKSVPVPNQQLVSDPSVPWSCISGYHDEVVNTNNNSSSSSSSSGTVMRAHSHPCHKPFESMEALIRTWTKPDDVILDCFAGSGGIPLAAVRLGRAVRGVEVLPQWAEYSQQQLKVAEVTYNNNNQKK
jgi:site-specific DNA-methyltransferase (adenine-specific)